MTQKTLLQSSGDGTAVPASYVGENYPLKLNTDTSVSTANTSLISQSLGAGTWLVSAGITLISATTNTGFISLYQGTTASPIGAETSSYLNSTRSFLNVSWVVNLSSPTVVGVFASVNTGSATAAGTGGSRCYFVATRIA